MYTIKSKKHEKKYLILALELAKISNIFLNQKKKLKY